MSEETKPISARVRELRHRSLPRFLALLAFDWAVIVLVIAAAAHFRHFVTYAIAWFVVGTRQHALGVLGHEGTHGLIHKNRRLNDLIARVFCFWPIVMPYEGYSPWHIVHHRHLGTDQDSENDVKHGQRFVLPTRFSALVLTFIGDLFGLGVRSLNLQITAFRPQGLKGHLQAYLGAIVLWAIAITLLIKAGLWWVPVLWFGALPTSFWAVFRVREFFEHTGTTSTYRYHLGLIGRFCFAPNYIWVHYEHHEWPFIPCYRLLAARKLDDSVPVLSLWQLIKHLEDPAYATIRMDERKTPMTSARPPLSVPLAGRT
jgi:fatty acid desaturase